MDSDMLFRLMVWALGILGTALVWLIVWYVRKTIAQLEWLRDLVAGPGQSHDRRIGRLEDWRAMVDRPRASGLNETDA